MNYRRLGASGLKVSELCLGAWIGHREPVDEAITMPTLDAALEAGINFFDLADMYARGEAEKLFGKWMKNQDRRQIVVVSKCWFQMWEGPNGRGLNRKHIVEACEDSLRRLGTDYIDLYLCHSTDADTPLEETFGAFDDLTRAGKILYGGCSNFSAALITEATGIAETRKAQKWVALEPNYSMLRRDIEGETVAACQRGGLGIIAYSPLAQGVLTNKYLSGEIPADSRGASTRFGSDYVRDTVRDKLPMLQALGKFAEARGLMLSQLALAWLLHQPAVVAPIIGASRPAQIAENVVASDVKLSAAELAEIEGILAG